jgi:hypothetical protein
MPGVFGDPGCVLEDGAEGVDEGSLVHGVDGVA